jgi:hypothetical protein
MQLAKYIYIYILNYILESNKLVHTKLKHQIMLIK